MADFWIVYETARGGITRYGAVHLCWLFAAAVGLSGSVCLYRRVPERRQCFRRVIAFLLVLTEFGKYAAVLVAGYPSAQYLPLHICSLGMFAAVRYAISPDGTAGAFLCEIALPGAFAALLFPGWIALPAGSFLSIHSFLFHILLIAAALLPLSAGEIAPSGRMLCRAAGMLLALTPAIHVINQIYETNFFFLERPPW